jgi:putative ABC transport system substrate-binding protein
MAIALVIAFAMRGAAARAQQPTKVHRIGYLNAVSSGSASDRIEPFRRGLRELGYREGENIVIESRYADGKLDRLPALAADLVRLKVEVIVTSGAIPTRHTKEATSTISIVMAQDNDPIGNGFVVSLSRPGGNITGLSTLAPQLTGKRLEILKEIVPNLSRLAVFGTSKYPGNQQALKEVELAATALKTQIQYVDIVSAKDLEAAFKAAVKGRADAVLLMVPSGVVNFLRKQITDLAVKHRLPATYQTSDYVEVGGLMSYGASIDDLNRRAATYVDKILRGAKPGDLPVEQPTKFELVINLKAAKQIGLIIPPTVLARADKVIR